MFSNVQYSMCLYCKHKHTVSRVEYGGSGARKRISRKVADAAQKVKLMLMMTSSCQALL